MKDVEWLNKVFIKEEKSKRFFDFYRKLYIEEEDLEHREFDELEEFLEIEDDKIKDIARIISWFFRKISSREINEKDLNEDLEKLIPNKNLKEMLLNFIFENVNDYTEKIKSKNLKINNTFVALNYRINVIYKEGSLPFYPRPILELGILYANAESKVNVFPIELKQAEFNSFFNQIKRAKKELENSIDFIEASGISKSR